MDRDHHIIKLRGTINPRTGKKYTNAELASLFKLSESRIKQIALPGVAKAQRKAHLAYQKRHSEDRVKARMVSAVEKKYTALVIKDWGTAYKMLDRLGEILREHQNV
jgi:hypothetical protein